MTSSDVTSSKSLSVERVRVSKKLFEQVSSEQSRSSLGTRKIFSTRVLASTYLKNIE